MTDYQYVKNRVSVVTPVYNGEKHLHRLLESVLAQDWDNIEMILVDDGSRDGTLNVADSFRNRFKARGFSFRIIEAQHRNASAAINYALPLVTGEFLIWPDSDDALYPDSISKRVSFLQENPQYQCVRSLAVYRSEDGAPCPPQENMAFTEREELFFPVLMGESFVCCGCYMLRCQAFFAIYPKKRIPEYDVGQNFQMLLPFLYCHRCPTISEELYTVYVRPDSHSHQASVGEQEERYAAFEVLVDQLADICAIREPGELFQIALWKHRRRYVLYRGLNKRTKTVAALSWLWVHGDIEPARAFRECIRVICGPRLLGLWRRLKARKF